MSREASGRALSSSGISVAFVRARNQETGQGEERFFWKICRIREGRTRSDRDRVFETRVCGRIAHRPYLAVGLAER